MSDNIKELKSNLNNLSQIIEELLTCLNKTSGIILLEGDLASGKTTFVKEFVKYFDIKDEVTSPTFNLQNIYGTNIYHYDIYSKGVNYFLQMGLFDMLNESGYHLIEWANEELANILKLYGFNFCHISISASNTENEDLRIYKVSSEWQN
jgi:tRNA threonylcarbamoyladenosine biosynthesis protein TsaE